jgi:predicted  nucleic acid-binding Zn-ribbon protein
LLLGGWAVSFFAAMTIAVTPMQETLRTLWGIQEIDRDLFRVQKELERLPAEREARERDLEALKSKIQTGKDVASELDLRVREIEEQGMGHRQRIRKLEEEASSSRDMAVIEACRYEMRELKREITRGERSCIEMLEQGEQEANGLSQQEAKLTVEEDQFAELRAGIALEIAEAEGRKEQLEAKRSERLGDDVNSDALKLYTRLLGARGGQAMALVDSQVCQACYMSIPPNMNIRLARGDSVIQCPSCDRILLRE